MIRISYLSKMHGDMTWGLFKVKKRLQMIQRQMAVLCQKSTVTLHQCSLKWKKGCKGCKDRKDKRQAIFQHGCVASQGRTLRHLMVSGRDGPLWLSSELGGCMNLLLWYNCSVLPQSHVQEGMPSWASSGLTCCGYWEAFVWISSLLMRRLFGLNQRSVREFQFVRRKEPSAK